MIKRNIRETIREYDKNGNLIRETVTETTEDDDTQYIPYQPQFVSGPVHCQTCNESLVLDAEQNSV